MKIGYSPWCSSSKNYGEHQTQNHSHPHHQVFKSFFTGFYILVDDGHDKFVPKMANGRYEGVSVNLCFVGSILIFRHRERF